MFDRSRGLALETVSRLFSRFQEDGLISVQGRQVQLVDLAGIKAVTEQTFLTCKRGATSLT